MAAFCKVAFLLCLLDPCAEGSIKPVESEQLKSECIEDRRDALPASSSIVCSVSVEMEFETLRLVMHSPEVCGCPPESGHTLSNGLRAPLVC